MSRIDQLRIVADEMLGDLHADERLRQRILHQAAKPRPAGLFSQRTLRILAPVTGALVIAVGALCALPVLKGAQTGQTAQLDQPGVHIATVAGGGGAASAEPIALAALDLPDDSITVTSPQNGPKFESIYATIKGANFPMVGLNGRAYRQIKGSLSKNALGESLGQVTLSTNEPDLADGDAWQSGILSNVASEGAEVYSVAGVSTDTAVAVDVGGKVYLFQRASFSGYGLDGQSLSDVLSVSGVESLVLSDVGTVSDAGSAAYLVDLLVGNAGFYSDEPSRGKQALTIRLSNGARLQMIVSGEVFSCCGAWSCPEFFDAFAQVMD